MNGWDELDRFLQTDLRDADCDQALRILHIYVQVMLDDESGAEAPEASRRRRAPARLL
jgi:hypothetical protein